MTTLGCREPAGRPPVRGVCIIISSDISCYIVSCIIIILYHALLYGIIYHIISCCIIFDCVFIIFRTVGCYGPSLRKRRLQAGMTALGCREPAGRPPARERCIMIISDHIMLSHIVSFIISYHAMLHCIIYHIILCYIVVYYIVII